MSTDVKCPIELVPAWDARSFLSGLLLSAGAMCIAMAALVIKPCPAPIEAHGYIRCEGDVLVFGHIDLTQMPRSAVMFIPANPCEPVVP